MTAPKKNENQELTVEEQLAFANTQITEYSAKIVELQTANAEQSAKIVELETANAEQSAKIVELEKDIEGYQATIKTLNDVKPSASTAKLGVVEIGSSKYQITMPALLHPEFGKISATDVLANSKIASQLLEEGSGMLQLIEE